MTKNMRKKQKQKWKTWKQNKKGAVKQPLNQQRATWPKAGAALCFFMEINSLSEIFIDSCEGAGHRE